MVENRLETPILFLIFNRLETTKKVFEVIRLGQPERLYIAADGPRLEHIGEAEKVKSVQDYVLSNIDWDCEVKTLIREQNLGCRKAVSNAIDWFFECEEAGIILEDDTVPDKSFFHFCQELLQYYRNDERIMSIVASNIQESLHVEYSYFFSCYSLMWGWATWRRAWKKYNSDMSLWPKLRETGWLLTVGNGNRQFQKYWTSIFNEVYEEKMNSWGFVWIFSCWVQNGLSIIPSNNLVRNIGFGEDATHTKKKDKVREKLIQSTIEFPLEHPSFVYRIYKAERYLDRHWFKISRLNNFKRKIRMSLKY